MLNALRHLRLGQKVSGSPKLTELSGAQRLAASKVGADLEAYLLLISIGSAQRLAASKVGADPFQREIADCF